MTISTVITKKMILDLAGYLGDFQVINLDSGTIRALPAEPFYLNRALMWAGLDFAQLKPHEFEDDWAVASTILQEWKFLYYHFKIIK